LSILSHAMNLSFCAEDDHYTQKLKLIGLGPISNTTYHDLVEGL